MADPVGPFPLQTAAQIAAAEVTYVPAVYVELYDNDGVTLLSTLANAFDVSWQDPLSDVGFGRFSLPLSDADAALVVPGCFVRCYLYGALAFTWVIKRQPERVVVDTSEEHGQILTAQGPGWVGVLDGARVYPYGGPGHPLNPQRREYSFAAPDFPNGSTWLPPIQHQRADELNDDRYQTVEIVTVVEGSDDVSEIIRVPAPSGWLVAEAYWIWGTFDTTTVGRNYFISSFVLAGQSVVTIAATADNFYTVFLDGIPILGDNENEACWQEHKQITVTLPAGTYYLCAVVENLPWPPEYVNPAGFLAAVYVPDANGDPLTVIHVTDSSWTALAYPASEPGWTPGQILVDARAEAQARSSIPAASFGFDDLSASDGAGWSGYDFVSRGFISGFSVPVGASMLEMLDALVGEGWIDYRMRPGEQVLDAWNAGSGGSTPGVAFSGGVDITHLSFGEAEPTYNVLLVKWGSGYLEITDAASVAALGRIEGFLTVDATSYDEALRLGQVAFIDLATPEPSIVVGIEPSDTERPYAAFGVGDYVTLPTIAGGTASVRVLAINVEQNDMGDPVISLECHRRPRIPERERYELLTDLGLGMEGASKVSIPLSTSSAVATTLGVP